LAVELGEHSRIGAVDDRLSKFREARLRVHRIPPRVTFSEQSPVTFPQKRASTLP
jgi:hypothetical protein